MYLTENEIFSQYESARKTYNYILSKADLINNLRKNYNYKSITFIGCGSGYALCQSAEMSARINIGIPSTALAGGDLLVNMSCFESILKETLLVCPSRSGSTSEVVLSVKEIKSKYSVPCIAICAVENSELSKLADLTLEIPWAFDESVCQTRTVTNLYIANLLLIAIIAENKKLIEEIWEAIKNGDKYIENNLQVLKDISAKDSWNKVVVLADCELQGIAAEGAIAFNEICQLPSNYYHLLDVRHGPMVLIDSKTLVIAACSSSGIEFQKDLIRDIKKLGATIIIVSNSKEYFNDENVDVNIVIPNYINMAVTGIPFINIAQIISYYKALNIGINPDFPKGLNPWIKL